MLGEHARCCPWRACQTRGVDTRSLSPGGPGVGGEVGRLRSSRLVPSAAVRQRRGPGRAFGGRHSMVTARGRPCAGLESPAECHGTEGTLCSHSHLECPPCLVLLWLRGLRGELWQRRGPRDPVQGVDRAPQFRGQGGLRLDACGFRPALWKGRARSSTRSSLCGARRSRHPPVSHRCDEARGCLSPSPPGDLPGSACPRPAPGGSQVTGCPSKAH